MFNYEDIFQRNIGVLTVDEQKKLRNSTIAIAGAGGDGGLVAETLARTGIGHIRLADPENFEISNLNRQNGSGHSTLNRNKAKVIKEIILDINPECNVEVFEKGVNEKNIGRFVKGADIIIDESEFTYHEIATMLAREARRNKIPLITGMNIGFGVLVFAFTEKSYSFEKYFGLDEEKDIKEVANEEIPIYKWCPWLPSYINYSVLNDVKNGKPVPGISAAVALVSATVTTEVVLYLCRKRNLITIPKYLWVDLYHRKTSIRRANIFSFYVSGIIMMVKSWVRSKRGVDDN